MISRFGKEEKKALCDLIDRSDKTLSNYSYSYKAEGGEVWKFEKEFARWLGRKYCVAVNSGTSALFVAINSLVGYDVHAPILLPAYTFVADAEAVMASRNYLEFDDIDSGDYCLLGSRRYQYAIAVHTLGNVCDPNRFKNYQTIEDCAQCVGGKWKGKKAGTFGDISIFSGQGTKNLGCGEGGWLCTDSEELMERIRAVSNHGDYYRYKFPHKKYPYLHNLLGYNLRMTEMQACIAQCQLKKLESNLRMFKKNAELIFDLLPDGIEPPYIPKEVDHAYFILGCKWKSKLSYKSRFLERLLYQRRKHGLLFSKQMPDIPGSNQPPGYTISSGYSQPLYDLPLYKRFARRCPNVEKVIEEAVWIDIHRWTSESRIQKEMEIFNKVYQGIAGNNS